MKRWKHYCFLLLLCFLLSACASERAKLTKGVRNSLNLQNAFLPPNGDFGPGNLMYKKKDVYQIACEPSRTINMMPADVKKNTKGAPIADFSVKKATKVSYDLKLTSTEKSVLKGAGVDAKYQQDSKIVLDFTNGKQYELYWDDGRRVTFDEIISGIKNSSCKQNVTRILIEEPGAKFFVSGIVYGYDIKYSLQLQEGSTVNVNIPEELLQVASAKLGFTYDKASGTIVGGQNLYAGFNGLPFDKNKKEVLGSYLTSKFNNFMSPMPALNAQLVTHSGVDITDIIRKEYLQ